MDTPTVWTIAGSIVGSTVAAVLAARWIRGIKQDRELGELKAKIEAEMKAAQTEKALEFRAVEHRLAALEGEQKVSRRRYHKLRGLVLKCLVKVGVPDREHYDDDED